MNPSRHCRTSIFEEFKFQVVRQDIHIDIVTQNIIWTLQISETVSWYKLQCCYSGNMLEH